MNRAGAAVLARASDLPRPAIGVRQPLIDGIEKVTGSARYTADLPARGALVGAILRSPVAHGRIHSIDAEARPRAAGRARRDHGRRLRHRLRRHSRRAERVSAGARARPLPRRADRRGRRRRRRDGARGARSDRARHRAPAGVLRCRCCQRGGRRCSSTRTSPAISSARSITRSATSTAAFAAADLVREERFHYAEVTHAMMEPNAALAAYDRGARPAHAAFGDAGSLLRASRARPLPRDGRVAHSRGEAVRRRRLRPSHRDAQLRGDRRTCSPAPPAAPSSSSCRARSVSSPIAAGPRRTCG